VSESEAQVWVNGSWSLSGGGGILPWTGAAPGSLDAAFVDGFDDDLNWAGSQDPFTVFDSGAYFRNEAADTDDLLAIFYRRSGGIGGVAITRLESAVPADWSWVMDQIDLAAQMGEALPAGTEPILDFAVGEDALYVVSAITTLKVSEELMNNETAAASDFFTSPYVGFAGGVADPIVSVALATAADTVFLGTENGLWTGATSSVDGDFFEAGSVPDRIDATAGYAVRTIEVSADGAYVAFINERAGSPDTLVVLDVAGESLVAYASMEGLPGEDLHSLSWLGTTLLVAGSGGLAALDVAP
jgi:hypothetical protein